MAVTDAELRWGQRPISARLPPSRHFERGPVPVKLGGRWRSLAGDIAGRYVSMQIPPVTEAIGVCGMHLVGAVAVLDFAGVDIGHRVLDVAAGTGEQTLLTAQRVGPTGTVLATDIAAQMLSLAEEAAAQAGLGNVETLVQDARELNVEPESFDAAVMRLALVLVPERARVMAGI